MHRSKFGPYIIGGATGAGLAYLFDLQMGRTRRARLADQMMARSRRAAREGERKARYMAGKAEGAMHRTPAVPGVRQVKNMMHAPGEPAPNLEPIRRTTGG